MPFLWVGALASTSAMRNGSSPRLVGMVSKVDEKTLCTESALAHGAPTLIGDASHAMDPFWTFIPWWRGSYRSDGLSLDTLLVSDAIQNEHLDASAASVWLKTQDSADDPAHSRPVRPEVSFWGWHCGAPAYDA